MKLFKCLMVAMPLMMSCGKLPTTGGRTAAATPPPVPAPVAAPTDIRLDEASTIHLDGGYTLYRDNQPDGQETYVAFPDRLTVAFSLTRINSVTGANDVAGALVGYVLPDVSNGFRNAATVYQTSHPGFRLKFNPVVPFQNRTLKASTSNGAMFVSPPTFEEAVAYPDVQSFGSVVPFSFNLTPAGRDAFLAVQDHDRVLSDFLSYEYCFTVPGLPAARRFCVDS